jgi:hypothetical protein
MLFLNQSAINIVYLTLSEAVPTTFTSSTPYFLFELESLTTNESIFFTAPNISTSTTRYDQFVITLTGASYQNLTAGTIHLPQPGEYIYKAYPQYSNTNVFLTGTTGTILELGIATVSGSSASTYITQEYSGQSTTYSYYQP